MGMFCGFLNCFVAGFVFLFSEVGVVLCIVLAFWLICFLPSLLLFPFFCPGTPAVRVVKTGYPTRFRPTQADNRLFRTGLKNPV